MKKVVSIFHKLLAAVASAMEWVLSLTLLILVHQLTGGKAATACDANFPLVPFGVEQGDILVPRIDDGSSSLIKLPIPFPYFGTNETDLYVNTNGILSFNISYTAYIPKIFSTLLKTVIAPFWIDIDTSNHNLGFISYRNCITSEHYIISESCSVSEPCIQQIILTTFSLTHFEIRQVFVATYDQVRQYGQPSSNIKNNTFQVVLTTDGQLSFVLFSYGDIQWGAGANIGFNSEDKFFMLPEALTSATEDIETSSNVGVPGLYVYRVDQDSIVEPIQNYTVGIKRGANRIQTSSDCPSQQTRDDITRDVFQLLSREFGVNPYGRVRSHPATSCEEIRLAYPMLGAGLYWISEEGKPPTQQYCS